MPHNEMSRRTFLTASGGAALALTFAGKAGATVPARNTAISPLVLSTDLYASPTPQRFVFAIAVGPRYSSGGPAPVGFVPPDAQGKVQVTLLKTRLDTAGLPKGRGVYVTDEAVFDQPGAWQALVLTKGKRVPFAVEVKPQPEAPAVGAAAPRVPSPTTTSSLGVHPICTRRPACPLHTVSLSNVIGAGKPVAALFATPALCQSMYCGPVLDEMLSVRGRYTDRITFVHIEIWKSNRGATKAPTVQAWGLPSEPWLYTIDATGRIVGRLDGAMGRNEMVRQLDVLAPPA